MDISSPHPELTAEQTYFDAAAEHRERLRARIDRPDAAAAGIHPKAMSALLEAFRVRSSQIGAPDQPVAYGRMDRDDGETFYIGRVPIFDTNHEPLVISWKSEVSAGFTQSSKENPLGVNMKRYFDTQHNTIRDILDEYLTSEDARHRPGPFQDALLRALSEGRDGRLRDIVQTIQAKQDLVMRAPADGALIVQGGPGTGKTIIGLQRISLLIYRERLEAEEMMFVGPNRGFLKYVSSVLPALGDEDVVRVAITDLSPLKISRPVREDPAVAEVKGDSRMEEVLASAIRDRRGAPDSKTALRINDQSIDIPAEKIRLLLEPFEQGHIPHNVAREPIREQLIKLVIDSRDIDGGAVRSSREFDNLMTRIWPTFSPQEFLRDLLSSERRLKEHGAPIFGEDRVLRIARPQQARLPDEPWTDADLALIDELEVLLNGSQSTSTYRHIVVDEAQDLSPIQLRAISRRAGGAITVLGDLAQATGAWAHRSWDEVISHLDPASSTQVELTIGYRVPSEIMKIASSIAEVLNLPVQIPEAIRDAGAEPEFWFANDEPVLRTAIRAVKSSLAQGLRVGVICAAPTLTELGVALDYEQIEWGDGRVTMAQPVTVVDAVSSKGLEFDSVVVLEPSDIVDGGAQGLNELFVAVTRSTRLLTVVYSRELPKPIASFAPDLPAPKVKAVTDTDTDTAEGYEPWPNQTAPSTSDPTRPGEPVVEDVGPEGASGQGATADSGELVEPEPTGEDTIAPSKDAGAADIGRMTQRGRENLADTVLDAMVAQVAQEVKGVLRKELWKDFVDKLIDELSD